MSAPETALPPLPTVRGEEALYFENLRQHRLVFHRCTECHAAVFPLRTVCPFCSCASLDIEESGGHGTVHSFTMQHRATHPYFKSRLPLTIALIDMAEGFRLMADIVRCSVAEVRAGLPVTAWYEDIAGELTLVRFAPANHDRLEKQ